ncbi:NAD(P)-binding protein [Fusarium pseudocircinatum]|uniref:NAD(P)-binding protein n=1 Tax=Fusarium pseudocircinatum TaxID=56676 RepID=A0A8H5L0S9_9HYPO|nr:NAD(P)-binding protein [Fusarium pseudocircinatum]
MRVAVVGVGFGAEFIPIYQAHPNVSSVALCDIDPKALANAAEQFKIAEVYANLEDVLHASHIDAVHLVTPIPQHAKQTIAVLRSGKHCACTVPMATSIQDLHDIITAQRETGKMYMMMETAVYTREFLMVQEHHVRGDFGQISFARGGHMQDMENWPAYWKGLPPHHYMTHAISPILHLLGKQVDRVHCFGSGELPLSYQSQYNNKFPVETAIFRLADSPVAVEVTRALFKTVRPYSESFAIYGDKLGFEWQQIEDESPLVFSMPSSDKGRTRDIQHQAVKPPNRADLLPPSLAPFTTSAVFQDGNHLSFVQGSGHGGSHPHLVHEFLSSILEGRPPAIDAVTGARWTAPGIAAHLSALENGKVVHVPNFM